MIFIKAFRETNLQGGYKLHCFPMHCAQRYLSNKQYRLKFPNEECVPHQDSWKQGMCTLTLYWVSLKDKYSSIS